MGTYMWASQGDWCGQSAKFEGVTTDFIKQLCLNHILYCHNHISSPVISPTFKQNNVKQDTVKRGFACIVIGENWFWAHEIFWT